MRDLEAYFIVLDVSIPSDKWVHLLELNTALANPSKLSYSQQNSYFLLTIQSMISQ